MTVINEGSTGYASQGDGLAKVVVKGNREVARTVTFALDLAAESLSEKERVDMKVTGFGKSQGQASQGKSLRLGKTKMVKMPSKVWPLTT